jgi:hypothetical protein
MADKRTIELSIDAVQMSKLAEALARDQLESLSSGCLLAEDMKDPRAAIFEAIGYLSTWNMTFPRAVILTDSYGDSGLIAHYYREDGSHGYAIAAVWHGDHFGFHS